MSLTGLDGSQLVFLFYLLLLILSLSSDLTHLPFLSSACACQVCPSSLIYCSVRETKVQEMEVRTHH